MAQVRLFGATFKATPITQYTDGSWLMESCAHAARVTIGTQFIARPNEIVSMDDPTTPQVVPSLASLDAAMAEERKTLPSVQELLARNIPATEKDKPDAATSD